MKNEKTEFRQKLVSETLSSIFIRNTLSLKKIFFLFLYYYFARFLPQPPMLGAKLGHWLRAFCVKMTFLKCGNNIRIAQGVNFGSGKGIVIGNNSNLSKNSWIANDTIIGNNVMLAQDVIILSQNHESSNINIPMIAQGHTDPKPVIVGDDVWIGARVIILPDVRVGSHSIIGAGAVVTKDVPEWSIVAGNPAKIIKMRK